MIIRKSHSEIFLNLPCDLYFTVWIWLRIHHCVATPVHRVGGWVSPNLTPVESVPPYPTPLSGEMSDQLKWKHLQLPSQNGQLFETNQKRTRTMFFRSFFNERVTPSIETQNPGPLAFGESLCWEKRATFRCQLPPFVICRFLSLMFLSACFYFRNSRLAITCEPPLVKCAIDVATRGNNTTGRYWTKLLCVAF